MNCNSFDALGECRKPVQIARIQDPLCHVEMVRMSGFLRLNGGIFHNRRSIHSNDSWAMSAFIQDLVHKIVNCVVVLGS